MSKQKFMLTKKVLSFVAAIALGIAPAMTTAFAAAPTVSEITPVDAVTNDSTPEYTFYTNQDGVIVYHGACVGDLLEAEAGTNTVTFKALADGTYNSCAIVVVNSNGEFSTPLTVSTFEVDTVAPTIQTLTEVSSPTNDPTPNFEFSSDEGGTITYGGSCSASIVSAAVPATTVTFNTLSSGTYSDCTIKVTDAAGNESNVLAVNEFTVETSASLDKVGEPALTDATLLPTAVESSRVITVNASAAGELSASGICEVYPTEIPAGQSKVLVYALVDGTDYAATSRLCVITLTTEAGNAATLDLSVFSTNLNISDSQDPSVSISGVNVQPNGSTVHVVYSANEGGTFSITDGPVGICPTELKSISGSFMPGTSLEIPLPNVPDGTHSTDADQCEMVFEDASTNTTNVRIPEFTVNDTQGPTLTLVEGPEASYSAVDLPVVFTVQSNEDVTSPTAGTNVIVGGVCAAISTVTFPGGDITANTDTTILIDFAPAGVEQNVSGCTLRIKDDNGNLGPVFTIPAFIADNTAPTLTLTSVPGTTPNPLTVSFTASEAGKAAIGAGCTVNGMSEVNFVSGSNTVTFDPLTAGSHSCTLTPEDSLGNSDAVLALGTVNITDNGEIKITGAQVDPKTMTLTFTSNEAGTISFAADSYCTSPMTEIKAGSNTIALNELPAGLEVDSCEFTATDIDGNTDTVSLSSFTTVEITEGVVAHRFFNTKTGSYLYVTDANEKAEVMNLPEFNYEGSKFIVKESEGEGLVPVYRFFNTRDGGHIFTISEDEKASISALSYYSYEGVKFYVYASDSDTVDPVFRFFLPDRGSVHLFTSSEVEKEAIETSVPNAIYEGTPFYVMPI